MLNDLKSGRCDFIAGAFYPDDDVHSKFATSITYLQDSYTWFVAPAPFLPRWEGLITIFLPMTWLVFALILMLSGLSWYFFGTFPPEDSAHKKVVMSCMNSFSVFIGVSSNNRPSRLPLRLFFVVLAVYGLNVTTIYTSNLITVFKEDKRGSQIDTVEEMFAANLEFGGREEYSDWFINDSEDDKIILEHYNTSDEYHPTNENMQQVADGKRVILANRWYVRSDEIHDDAIVGFTDDVFSNPIEMIAERGFPLLPKFNIYLSDMIAAGLVERIYNRRMFRINILNEIKEIKANLHEFEEPGEIVLTTEHLQGAFALYICGILFCIFIFILELFSVSRMVVWLKRKIGLVDNKLDKVLIRLQLKENPKKFIKIRNRAGLKYGNGMIYKRFK